VAVIVEASSAMRLTRRALMPVRPSAVDVRLDMDADLVDDRDARAAEADAEQPAATTADPDTTSASMVSVPLAVSLRSPEFGRDARVQDVGLDLRAAGGEVELLPLRYVAVLLASQVDRAGPGRPDELVDVIGADAGRDPDLLAHCEVRSPALGPTSSRWR
jgi:hypothetical protein